MGHENLIMAVSYGYTHAQLGVFLRSLAKAKIPADLVLFVGGTDRASQAQLREDGVILVPFWYPFRNTNKLRTPFYRYWPQVRPLLARLRDPGLIHRISSPFLNISIRRLGLYRSYLAQRRGEYERVFLTDLRDVSFQGDPFPHVAQDELRVYLEDGGHTHGECPVNSRWITELYGPGVAGEMAAKPVICSGTILGGCEPILSYLDAFLRSLSEARSVMRMGMDQGIHNYLIHRGRLGALTICENRRSEVLTMGLMPPEALPQISSEGLLLDGEGIPYPVLHQADRHPGLWQQIVAANT